VEHTIFELKIKTLEPHILDGRVY